MSDNEKVNPTDQQIGDFIRDFYKYNRKDYKYNHERFNDPWKFSTWIHGYHPSWLGEPHYGNTSDNYYPVWGYNQEGKLYIKHWAQKPMESGPAYEWEAHMRKSKKQRKSRKNTRKSRKNTRNNRKRRT